MSSPNIGIIDDDDHHHHHPIDGGRRQIYQCLIYLDE
jgi:hypothetical protein